MAHRLRGCALHIAILVVAVVLYGLASGIDSSVAGSRIGPAAWPKAVILFMGALCIYEIVKRLLQDPQQPPGPLEAASPADAAPADVQVPTTGGSARRLWGGMAVIAGYVLVVPWVGFFATTALFLLAFPVVAGFRRYGWIALTALVGAFSMVVLFVRIAYISLPLGQGPFQQLSVWLMAMIGVK